MVKELMVQINKNAQQLQAPIVSNRRVGQYHQILIAVGEVAALCKPGNFVAISIGGETSQMILQRAFAISRVSAGTMELIIAPLGQGSKWICAQREGVKLDLIAPLGTAFGIPTQPVHALLIGGGYGSAPLFGLAEVLSARGCRVDMLLGASTASKIYAPMEGKRSVNALRIYTEDGSMGTAGRVTDPIRDLVAGSDLGVIYSCGPMPMLAAVSSILEGTDVVHQCSVEESMACGVGICMTCVLPVKGADGAIAMLRSCIDGPVMDGSHVQWDLVGEISS